MGYAACRCLPGPRRGCPPCRDRDRAVTGSLVVPRVRDERREVVAGPGATTQGTAQAAAGPSHRPGSVRPHRVWVGRTYAHVALPRAHVDDACVELLDAAVGTEAGWYPVDPVTTPPVLYRRWRHERGGTLVAIVVGWYPLLLTIGTDGWSRPRVRRARQHVVDAVLQAGGRAIADRDLDRVIGQSRQRWDRAVALHTEGQAQQELLERRRCGRCGCWSAYSASHCSRCGGRFTGADDAERDEQGRRAEEAMARASDELAELARGAGMFTDWTRERAE